jgi:hypothetical protein
MKTNLVNPKFDDLPRASNAATLANYQGIDYTSSDGGQNGIDVYDAEGALGSDPNVIRVAGTTSPGQLLITAIDPTVGFSITSFISEAGGTSFNYLCTGLCGDSSSGTLPTSSYVNTGFYSYVFPASTDIFNFCQLTPVEPGVVYYDSIVFT